MEANEFNKVTRRSQKGGAHVFIPSYQLNIALEQAGINVSSQNLKMKCYPTKDRKGVAKIIVQITEITEKDIQKFNSKTF